MVPPDAASSSSSAAGELRRPLRLFVAGIIAFITIALLDDHPASAQLSPSDTAALQAIHRSLRDVLPPQSSAGGAATSSFFFESWDFSHDPCSFDGVLCDVVGTEERVVALNLGVASGGSAGLRGRLPAELGDLSALIQLTLAPGRVGGSIPASIAALSRLQNLGLSHNLLTGGVPATLSRLRSLRTLDLSFNRLSGSVPQELAALPSLITLSLAHNRLSGSLPTSFRSAANLLHLDLRRNAIDGNLPALPPSLAYLDLSRNRLSGSIAPLSHLSTSLAFLDLSDNLLTGEIPPSLFESTLLSTLALRKNMLSGEVVPAGLVLIPTVDLAFNSLTGPISPFFAFTRNLYLNNNHFTGAVPQEFVDQLLTGAIHTLFLQHNYLTRFPLDHAAALPPSAAVCVQYNCMEPPIDSLCPHSGGGQAIRPSAQCSRAT